MFKKIFGGLGHGIESLIKSLFQTWLSWMRKVILWVLKKLHIISIVNRGIIATIDLIIIIGSITLAIKIGQSYEAKSMTKELDRTTKLMNNIMTTEKFYTQLII